MKKAFSGIMKAISRKGTNGKMAHQKIIYQLTDKRIPAASGIGIVGDILERAEFLERFRDVKIAKKRSRKQIDAGDLMATFFGECKIKCVSRKKRNRLMHFIFLR